MTKYILLFPTLFFTLILSAQSNLRVITKDSVTKEPLYKVSAIVKNTTIAGTSDSTGQLVLRNIPNGKQTITFSHIGFEPISQTFVFPLAEDGQPFIIFLMEEQEELDEIIIQSTRTSRTFKNTPTRIETIDAEELGEKTNMRPANVAMVLHESTGIQVQQTSATSGNASVRLQGLDGRYTQLLKDGYPSFGNFAGGLSILEIPPLDLKQVEIIKGPASTLYGGGAIAGVINFISKTPQGKPEYNLLLNQSNIGQSNIGGFAMARNKKTGYSLLALYNYQKPYDVDKDDFTEIPKSNDFTIHPKLFFYPTSKATIIIGNSFTHGNRTGGDINVIKDDGNAEHTYFETNITTRNTTTLDYTQKLKDDNQLMLKSSYSYFNRKIETPGYRFGGTNRNFFTDISYVKNAGNQTLIFGGNYIQDKFSEQKAAAPLLRNFNTSTIGLYAQHTWDISSKIKSEIGVRTDIVNYNNQFYSNSAHFILPRVSVLYKFNSAWSSRIGGGLGYKTPTLFTEQTETFQYTDLLPLQNVSSEKSYGATADINFKTTLGDDFTFSFNHLFFYTNIQNAAILQTDNSNNYFFSNTSKPVHSSGFETNAKLIFKKDLKFFLGYTFTYAKAGYLAGNQFLPLLPRNKLNLTLLYEKENNFKIGFEAYFTDRQYLYNKNRTPSFWELGLMAEKKWGKITLFANAENFTDTRQSRYKRVVNPPHNNPTFDDIWTHTEGSVFNGGIKLKW